MNTMGFPGEPASKKTKTALSVGDIMAAIFWDSTELIAMDFVEKERTTVNYWIDSLTS